MSGISISDPSLQNKNITANAKTNNTTVEEVPDEKHKIKQSKTPDRLANSMGVVAGTSGMIGGGIIGGTVGVFKLPTETVKVFANYDYTTIIQNTCKDFSGSFGSNESVKGLKESFSKLLQEIKSTNSTEAIKELLDVAKTMSSRLGDAFKNDTDAKKVIDKVFGPLISSVSGGKNKVKFRDLIAKDKTSIITDKISKIFEGISETINNIQNFNQGEKEAWGKVLNKMMEELKANPNIKNIVTHIKSIFESLTGLKELIKGANWIVEPLKKMQTTFVNEIKKFDKKLSFVPVNTIGKYAFIGSFACGTISVLSWLGLKKILMPKSRED